MRCITLALKDSSGRHLKEINSLSTIDPVIFLKDGRVYMVDYEILKNIPCYDEKDDESKKRYACPALGLFYVQGRGRIVPIAIQFHQEPSETNPIWTPNDPEMDWIYAKMWLKNADCQWHQVNLKDELTTVNHAALFSETSPRYERLPSAGRLSICAVESNHNPCN